MPWLFIGSMQHATMTSRLRELGITAVLNVSTQAISPRAKTPNVLYEQLAVEDGWNSELKTWLPKAIDILGSFNLHFLIVFAYLLVDFVSLLKAKGR